VVARTSRSSSTKTLVALLGIGLIVGVVVIVRGYGGETFWPGLVAGFLGTLLAFLLALGWERERSRAELAREASDAYERRQTELERRLEPVRAELKKNAQSLEILTEVFERKDRTSAFSLSVGAPDDRARVLANPQLLEGAWSASASHLAELTGDYELIAGLATFYGRVEELRWRIRLRTEQRSTDLDEAIHALVIELREEVDDLLERVGQEISHPHVRPTGLVHVRSIGAAVETSAAMEVEVIRGTAGEQDKQPGPSR
jgi:hypothetical protein